MYNITKSIKKDFNFIFNTCSSAVLVLDDAEFLQYVDLEFSNDELFSTLCNNGVLVDADELEFEKLLVLQKMKYLSFTGYVNYQILPTTFCNAKCYYCYEKDCIAEHMDFDTVMATCAFIKKNSKNDNKIGITWYGGEPLVRKDIIYYISENLIKFCAKEGKEFESSIITNGYLIDEEVIEQFRRINLKKAQLSFDGYGSVYNEVKQISPDAFFVAIRSIEILLKNNIDVVLRLNIDKNNHSSILELIDFFKDRIGNAKGFTIYPALIYLNNDNLPDMIIRPKEAQEYFKPVYEKLISFGYISNINSLNFNFTDSTCSAVYFNAFSISPTGEIYKCQHYIGDKSEIVGNVKDGLVFNTTYYKWCDPKIAEECVDCAIFPMCQGGCRACEEKNFSLGRCNGKRYLIDLFLDLIQKINKF